MTDKTYTAFDMTVAHDSAYQNGEADGQMKERERIVEWLGHFDPATADAIQRGEHWQ